MGDAAELRESLIKSTILGQDVQRPASLTDEEGDLLRSLFKQTQVIDTPFDPFQLLRIWENSNALNPNVEAYMVNIDGLGHRLEPVIDFDSPDVLGQVREALVAQQDVLTDVDELRLPSDEEVEEALVKLKRRTQIERIRLNTFLDNANPDGSFVSLRRNMRQHLEIMGNAYWEVLRNKAGRIARFVHVSATQVRLTTVDDEPTEVKDKIRIGLVGNDEVVQHRFFRRFVQAVNRKHAVYFKEFGDPRVVSRVTGKIFKDEAEFKANTEEGKDFPATEMIHFKLPRPGEPYGVPRWIGNLLAVLGSRAADEVNFDYFDNKAIPPLALLVQGGRLGADDVSRIETYIRDNIKGRSNFHKILVIEAQNSDAQMMAGNAPAPKLEFKELSDSQQGDALFQKYDERNIDKVGSSFRLPRLMRGDVRDFNRATALASLRFAEEQVFEPERKEFDAMFNRRILPELDIWLWKFRSNGHQTRDPETIAEIAERLVKAPILTPNEARELVSDVLVKDYDPLPDVWAQQPLPVTLAGVQPGDEGGSLTDEALRNLNDEATRLADEQEALLDAARTDADNEANAAVTAEQEDDNDGQSES